MGKLQTMVLGKAAADRDAQLREAHQRAFGAILEAKNTTDYQERTHQAVAELIEACERYCERHA